MTTFNQLLFLLLFSAGNCLIHPLLPKLSRSCTRTCAPYSIASTKYHQRNRRNNNHFAYLSTSITHTNVQSTLLYSSASDEPMSIDRNDTKVTISSILNAALLISGTTIGGGFLALPTVTQPIGFIPSSITLFGVWLYFLFQSFILVEAIQLTREENLLKAQKSIGNDRRVDDDYSESSMVSTTYNANPGVSSVAGNVFGRIGEFIVGLLLTILIEATLVSQISRAGLMMYNDNYKLGCALSSLSIALLVFGPKHRGVEFASNMNSILTIGFLCSVAGVFGCGFKYAEWNCLGIASLSTTTYGIDFRIISNIIPTFLQLLVYGEIVPCVCELLRYKTKPIHLSILLGSFLTLLLQIGWSGLGLSMISSTTPGLVDNNDVVNLLLQQGGIVRFPLLCLSVTAILTTILGSYLALLTMFNNIYASIFSRRNSNGSPIGRGNNTNRIIKSSSSLKQRFIVGGMISLPALSIASTSPSMFLKAIDFAGSYPVLMLWGILPPIMVLIQRFRLGSDILSFNRNTSTSSGPSSWLISLIILSLGYFGMNARNDLIFLLQKITNK